MHTIVRIDWAEEFSIGKSLAGSTRGLITFEANMSGAIVTRRIPAHKSVIAFTALALALPLALTACGNKEESADSAQSSAAPATSAAPKSQNPDDAKKAEEEKKKAEEAKKAEEEKKKAEEEAKKAEEEKKKAEEEAKKAAEEQKPADNAEGEMPTLANPLEDNPPTVVPLPPVENGQAANEQVKAELTELVGGIYKQRDMRSFTRYIPEHSCKQLLDQQETDLRNVDYDQLPQTPIEQVMGPEWAQIGLQSLDNVQVNGDDASADVTVNSPQGPDTSTMRFHHEGGRWTFCTA